MTVLVIADIVNNELSIDLTGKTVNAVSSLGDVTVLCACEDAASASNEAAKIKGVNKVLNISNVLFKNGLAEPMSALIVELSENYDFIVFAWIQSTGQGNDQSMKKNLRRPVVVVAGVFV